MVPPVAEKLTVTFTVSPVFLTPNAENCWKPPVESVVLFGLMTTCTRRRFFTLDVPLMVDVVSEAVTSTSLADVSAVYIPPDVMSPAEAVQRTETGTLSPACVRPKA